MSFEARFHALVGDLPAAPLYALRRNGDRAMKLFD
jgi:hypothetical protein